MSKAEQMKRYREKYKERIKEHNKEYNKSIKGKYVEYRKGAKVRGHSFNISFEEFSSFWQSDCYYCGSAIATIGLDRIDSSVGYSVDNVVSCCSFCNRMKNDLEQEDWYNKMLTILKHRKIL